MKSQIAHEVTELSVLQCHASEQRVELVEAWKECLTLAGTNSKNKKKRTVTDLIDSMVLLPCQVSAVVDSIFFEEIANFVTRCKEVIVTNMVVVTRRELGLTTMNSPRVRD